MARGEDQDSGQLGQVQSLVRAFKLLEMVGQSDEGLTLTEVSGLTKLPRSTAHRLLTTMNALRYVDFDQATSRWLIGHQALAFATASVQVRDIGRLGKSIMRSLMHEANQTVNIAISDVDCVRYVAQVRSGSGPQGNSRPGSCLPINTTATGKALLAHASPDEVDHFLQHAAFGRRTRASITESTALFSEFALIRARGYAIDDEENELGIRCVAAPVFDRNQRVRASLSISGGIARMPDCRLELLGQTLSAAARRFSQDFGMLLAA